MATLFFFVKGFVKNFSFLGWLLISGCNNGATYKQNPIGTNCYNLSPYPIPPNLRPPV